MRSLGQRLAALAQARVLRASDRRLDAADRGTAALQPYLDVFEMHGVASEVARTALRKLRIAVLGLSGAGAHAATLLAKCGVGRLLLLDPASFSAADAACWPVAAPAKAARSRAQALAATLRKLPSECQIVMGERKEITEAGIAQATEHADVVIACFGRSFMRGNQWVNRAGLAAGVPTLYAEIAGSTAWLGPLVLPGQTACFACYRLRRLACEADCESAVRDEEALDTATPRAGSDHGRTPLLAAYVGSLLAQEALALLVGPTAPVLAGKLLRFEGTTLQTRTSAIAIRADCPACGAKKKASRRRVTAS